MAALLLLSCSAKRAAEKTSAADSDVNYSEFFTGKTMRFDFHHAGNSTSYTTILTEYCAKENGPVRRYRS